MFDFNISKGALLVLLEGVGSVIKGLDGADLSGDAQAILHRVQGDLTQAIECLNKAKTDEVKRVKEWREKEWGRQHEQRTKIAKQAVIKLWDSLAGLADYIRQHADEGIEISVPEDIDPILKKYQDIVESGLELHIENNGFYAGVDVERARCLMIIKKPMNDPLVEQGYRDDGDIWLDIKCEEMIKEIEKGRDNEKILILSMVCFKT